MSKRKTFLIVSSVLWVLTAGLLAGTVIGLYREGTALQVADPLAWIFTRERMADRLVPLLPPVGLCLVLTVAGLLLGIRDESPGQKPSDTDFSMEIRTAPGVRGLRIAFLVLAAALIVAGVGLG